MQRSTTASAARATSPSIDTAPRGLVAAIAVVSLLALALTLVALACGGRPDPPSLRAAATLLDGPWRFHTGDDARWADAGLDDGAWDTLDLTAPPGSHDGDVGLPDYVSGWMAHGHPGYTGYAWYRRAVDVPAGPASWDLLGPTQVDDGYELYWNGRLLGGSGTLGAHPRVVGTRPLRFALPAEAAGTRGVLAVRVFMLPRPGAGTDGGGMHAAPLLAPRPASDGLHLAQWERTIAGYIVDAIEPLLMVLLAGLALWGVPRSRHRGFLAFASAALVLMAARRLENALVSWTDVMDLRTYSMLAKYLGMPAVAAWAMAWNRWPARAWRLADAAALAIMAVQVAGVAAHSSAAGAFGRYAAIALFAVLAARVAREGAMRAPALATLALTVLSFSGGELLDPLGVPGIWFPFGIGVSRTQYLYAVFIPLLAWLVAHAVGRPRADDTAR